MISFHIFCFELQKTHFPAIFCVFRFVLNFCDFSTLRKTCHSRLRPWLLVIGEDLGLRWRL